MPRSRQTARYKRLAELLLAARRSAGLHQVELSDRLGRPQTYVSKYERGERRLDVVEFLEVAEAIGCSAEAIVAALAVLPPDGGQAGSRPKQAVRPG